MRSETAGLSESEEMGEEYVEKLIALRKSTKLALDSLGKKNENYDDLLRRLLADNPQFQEALKKAYESVGTNCHEKAVEVSQTE